MIERLIKLEQERLSLAGFDTIVTPHEVTIASPMTILTLANETWIMTGIRVSDADMMGADHLVSFSSPTNSFQATERAIAQLGGSVHRLFRHHIDIEVAEYGKEFTMKADIPDFTLMFVRITPIVRQTTATKK